MPVSPGLSLICAARSGCEVSTPVSTIATDTPAAGGPGPGLRDVHVGVRVALAVVAPATAGDERLLAGVLEAPEVAEVRVRGLGRLDGDRLGEDDVGVAVELGDGLGQVALARAHDLRVRERAAAHEVHVGVGAHVGALGRGQAGLAPDDDLGRALAVQRLHLRGRDGRVARSRARTPRRALRALRSAACGHVRGPCPQSSAARRPATHPAQRVSDLGAPGFRHLSDADPGPPRLASRPEGSRGWGYLHEQDATSAGDGCAAVRPVGRERRTRRIHRRRCLTRRSYRSRSPGPPAQRLNFIIMGDGYQ